MIAHRLFVLALLLTSLACPFGSAAVEPASEQPGIEVFVRQGCPYCTEAKRFLEDPQRDRPSLRIVLRDLEQDKTALRQLQELAARYASELGGMRFRTIPLTDRDAAQMVREIKGYRLLQGYHAPATNVEAIEEVLLRLSRLVEVIPEISELDLNPIFTLPPGQGCKMVDARIRVDKSSLAI